MSISTKSRTECESQLLYRAHVLWGVGPAMPTDGEPARNF